MGWQAATAPEVCIDLDQSHWLFDIALSSPRIRVLNVKRNPSTTLAHFIISRPKANTKVVCKITLY